MVGRQYPVKTLLRVTAGACLVYAGYLLLSSYKTVEQPGRAQPQDLIAELDREARVSTASYWGVDSSAASGVAQKEGK